MASDAVVEGVSGGIGSVISLLCTYPLKIIYTFQAIDDTPRLSADGSEKKFSALLDILSIIKRYRLQGLYIGIGPSVAETAASSGIYFYLYSLMRQVAVSRKLRAQGRPGLVSAAAGGPADSGKDVAIGVLPSLLISAAAGVGQLLLTSPLQVLATRMAAAERLRRDLRVEISSDCRSVARQLYSEAGLLGFWRGLAPNLVLVSNPIVYYTLYEQIVAAMRRVKRHGAHGGGGGGGGAAALLPSTSGRGPPPGAAGGLVKLNMGETFLAGALAKLGATVVTYPLIVVKSRLQTVNEKTPPHLRYAGPVDAARKMYGTEGLGSFFHGMQAKLAQTVLGAALTMSLKDQLYSGTKLMLQASPA